MTSQTHVTVFHRASRIVVCGVDCCRLGRERARHLVPEGRNRHLPRPEIDFALEPHPGLPTGGVVVSRPGSGVRVDRRAVVVPFKESVRRWHSAFFRGKAPV